MGAFIAFLCWGSFLNVVGFRLLEQQSLFGRSACPACKTKLAWYDLIPVVSWVVLRGACRTCSAPISWLYPFIELLTAVLGILVILYVEPRFWLGYSILFSALIVTIRTDLQMMLISRYMTWGILPLGVFLSGAHLLPLSALDSIAGACFGYGILWAVGKSFHAVRKKEGLGEGDLDLLAMIGSFTGVFGTWIALLLGAFFGSLVGLFFVLKTRKHDIILPFGPWLALGAIIYVFFQHFFASLIWGV